MVQFERTLILERQREAIVIAKREEKYQNVGKPTLSDEQVGELHVELANGAKVAALVQCP